nr:hypothetical protein CFP56_03450 [Quercus suber]
MKQKNGGWWHILAYFGGRIGRNRVISLLVIWEDDAELMKCRKKLILFADLLAVLLTRKDRVDVDLLAMILWLIGPEEMLLDWANLPLNTIRFKLELCCTCWSINLPRCVTEG